MGCEAGGASGRPSRGTRCPRARGLSVEARGHARLGKALWWTGHGEQFYLGVQDELQGEATVDRYAWSPAVRLSNAEFASERGLGALRTWGI